MAYLEHTKTSLSTCHCICNSQASKLTTLCLIKNKQFLSWKIYFLPDESFCLHIVNVCVALIVEVQIHTRIRSFGVNMSHKISTNVTSS
jgi:hypothetical protein